MCKFREVYEPLLAKYKANLYFAGHSHHYQRTFKMFQNKRDEEKGTVHMVVGTGGYELTNGYHSTPDWIASRQGGTFG